MILVVQWLERLRQWLDVISLNGGITLSILVSKLVQKSRLGIETPSKVPINNLTDRSFELVSDGPLIPELEPDRTSTLQNSGDRGRDAKAISFTADHFFYYTRS